MAAVVFAVIVVVMVAMVVAIVVMVAVVVAIVVVMMAAVVFAFTVVVVAVVAMVFKLGGFFVSGIVAVDEDAREVKVFAGERVVEVHGDRGAVHGGDERIEVLPLVVLHGDDVADKDVVRVDFSVLLKK